MTAGLESLSPVLDAVPGASSVGRVRVTNASSRAATFAIRVVGLDAAVSTVENVPTAVPSAFTVVVPANDSVECAVPVPIPIDIAVGQHAAAFQATSDQPGQRPLLAPFTVSIESVDKVHLTVEPSPIRGRRYARFLLGISNEESTPVAFTLDAEAQDVRVKFKTSAFTLVPGQRTSTQAKVRGPRFVIGEPVQHNLVISARGKASATTITAPFVQRPLFAGKSKALLAALTVVALWLAAIGGVALWVSSRNDDTADDLAASAQDAALVRLVDADGNVLENGPYTALADGTVVDADGNVVDGFSVDANGNLVDDKGNPVNGVTVDPVTGVLLDANGTPIGLPPMGADGSDDGSTDGSGDGETADGAAGGAGSDEPVAGLTAPTSTLLRGTVAADGTTDLSDVVIRLVPMDLGTRPTPGATVVDPSDTAAADGVPGSTSATKVWSARFAPSTTATSRLRQTEPAEPLEAGADGDGVWLIPDVQLRRTYELSFAKPGFDTQAFVISPPNDGTPVELDVTMTPASGRIAGRVLDAGRPLGGVEIALSDGTLTFTTTSSTDGDVGAFDFDGVSTPGVYTLVATRTGYGTEVLQLPMEAGQERTGVSVDMQDGVATVSGSIVNEAGTPLGGVRVTASNGDITRTTTSLTEGNRGFYSIPQLDIPGTYTVTVEAPGYLPQTRRVPMSGSVGGVSFAMISTTARLTGLVRSAGGGGIVGALVTLSDGDLEFEVSTAASPQAGAFAVDELPPGTYTVRIEHFQHETITELLEIVEGVDPPLLDLTMPVRTRGIAAGTGSLVVEVVDPGAENAAEREILGATVTLVTTRTGQVFTSLTDDDSFTFEFSDVPVGTYTILVSAPRYNDAAPRTVSIGRSQERRTVEMVAFGAASGSMIDSITGEAITGYTVKFFEQDAAGGSEREIGPAEVNVPSSSTTGVWATAPRVLPTGIYRLEVSGAAGYREPTDQILGQGLPPMQFVVELNSGEATEIPVLVADRYPDIFGRVYEPFVTGGPAAPDTGTQFRAIDDPSLEASMSCDGGPAVPMRTRSEFGSGDAASLDAFFLTRQAVDANGLIGDCEITVTADGYVTGTIPMPNVKVSDGVSLSDRVVTTALVPPTDPLAGEVFWIDPRTAPTKLPLVGVEVFADPITSIRPTDAGPVPPGQPPSVARTPISTESVAGGEWSLPGQIFGGARYTFREPGFQDGTVDVIVDENQDRTVTDVGGVIVTENGTRLSVQLQPPDPVQVVGSVRIRTIDTPRFDAVTITATDPFSGTVEAFPTTDPACTSSPPGSCIRRDGAGNFVVDGAAAGTCTVDFTVPFNHRLFGSSQTQVSHRIGPQQPAARFDTELVELATLDVALFDRGGPGAPASMRPNVTLRLTPTPANPGPTIERCYGTGTDGSGAACLAQPDDGVYSISEIPVDPTDPVVDPELYTLEVVAAGYDQDSGIVTVTRGSVDDARGLVGSRSIPLGLLAGDKPSVRIELLAFGKIVLDVRGEIEECAQDPVTPGYDECAGAYEPLLLTVPTGSSAVPVDFTVTKVDRFGNAVAVDTDLIGINDLGNGGIEVLGPPGYYRVDVTHPQYETTPLEVPSPATAGIGCTSFCAPSASPRVYQLENNAVNTLDGHVTLRLRRSVFDLQVLLALDGAVGVEAATYQLQVETAPGVFTDRYTGQTSADGTIASLPVLPRTVPYRLRISKADHFTAITTIVVQRSQTGLVGRDPYTISVRAPLPEVGGSITGTIVALNSDNQPVDLPSIAIAADYEAPTIEVDGADQDNASELDAAVGSTVVPQPFDPSGPPPTSEAFTLGGLPTGDFRVAFTVPDGFDATFGDGQTADSTSTALDATLTSSSDVEALGTLTYVAADVPTVTLEVAGTSGAEIFPDLRVQLLPPGVDPASAEAVRGDYDGTIEPDEAPDNRSPVVVTFTDVAPYSADYTVLITDALHATTSVSRKIGASTTTVDLGTLTPDATTTRIRGSAQRLTGTNSTPGPIDPSTTQLAVFRIDPVSGARTDVTPTGDDAFIGTDRYFFDLPATGSPTPQYEVVMSESGFTTATSAFSAVAGQPVDRALEIVEVATISITVNPFAPDGLDVDAQESGGAVVQAVRDTPGGNTFTALVPPGRYRIRVQEGGLADPVYSSTSYTQVSPGVTVPITVTIPRSVVVNVGNRATGKNAKVSVRTTANPNTEVAVRQAKTNTFTFSESDGIPSTGDLIVVVSGENRRALRLDVPDALRAVVEADLQDLLQVQGTLDDASGVPVAGVRVTATPAAGAGLSVITDDTDANGLFVLPGLANDASDGSSVTWTLSADEIGRGVASRQVEVDGATPGPLSGQDLQFVPQNIDVTLTVRDSNGPLAGALVTIPGATPGSATTGAAGTATFSVPENVNGYTISRTDYDTVSGSFTYTNRNPLSVPPITMTVARATVRFVVSADYVPSGGTALAGATVTLLGYPTAGTDTTVTPTTGSDGVVTYEFPVTAGPISYRVTAPDYADATGSLTNAEVRAAAQNPATANEPVSMLVHRVGVRFVVEDAAGDPVDGATVAFAGGSLTTLASPAADAGTATFSDVPVNAPAALRGWQVSKTGYTTVTGSVTNQSLRDAFLTAGRRHDVPNVELPTA